MTAPDAAGPLPEAHFHAGSDALRFWVPLPAQPPMGAIISRQVLQHRFKGRADGSDALATYAANQPAIDAAVVRRAAQGALEPVMLREHDLPATPR